ncbi:MAG: hypothetical protein HETSPECPRED_007336 [Heterodermia speciosa]|uniref:FAD-binding domain-containing protein n=1 Tax=Heterodermia speciosa TaxID=116794 RepID=A0A8H3FUG1_9LECA|nr:MAG: hypothetical protein HETSPECPRED_007336 [Heterodermia speciosa]
MTEAFQVDVLICGGGPVGLLISYCLERYGISTFLVEQNDRSKQIMYGRAVMIAPRSLEIFDQLDLADALGQIGFVTRQQISYKDGKRVDSISAPTSNITDTFFDYVLICRQRYTEDVIHDAYFKLCGKTAQYGTRWLSYGLDGDPDYPVLSHIQTPDGKKSVRSKYLIGADGGRSKVREFSKIAFEGSSNNRHWIRIDGIVKTDMPGARSGRVGIQSASHGSILWACLDHGRTRVGFALSKELWEKLGSDITQADVIAEAQKALQPFTLEFEFVDWWTVYSVGQRLANSYRQDRVLIAGDAAHTHSSGAAQGLNTGLHDAVNLSWKLAGYIKGWYPEDILDTYDSERRPIAQEIIRQDKIISALTSGDIPEEYQNDAGVDSHQLLSENFKKNTSLNTGLGIQYPHGLLIDRSSSLDLGVLLGARAPDVLVQRPGIRVPIRLYSVIKFRGKFIIMIFCGDPIQTAASIKQWQDHLESDGSYKSYPAELFHHVVIVATSNNNGAAAEKIGADLGEVLYDVDNTAYGRYGISPDQGALLVLRPDGVLAAAYELAKGPQVSDYFGRVLNARLRNGPVVDASDQPVADGEKGEIELDKDGILEVNL